MVIGTPRILNVGSGNPMIVPAGKAWLISGQSSAFIREPNKGLISIGSSLSRPRTLPLPEGTWAFEGATITQSFSTAVSYIEYNTSDLPFTVRYINPDVALTVPEGKIWNMSFGGRDACNFSEPANAMFPDGSRYGSRWPETKSGSRSGNSPVYQNGGYGYWLPEGFSISDTDVIMEFDSTFLDTTHLILNAGDSYTPTGTQLVLAGNWTRPSSGEALDGSVTYNGTEFNTSLITSLGNNTNYVPVMIDENFTITLNNGVSNYLFLNI